MIDVEGTKKFFDMDRFCRVNGITIESITEDEAVCKVIITDNHLNAGDTVQGGVIFTIADFTFAALANACGKKTVLQSASITYVRPAVGEYLIAKSRKINSGKTTCLYITDVFDDKDRLVAMATLNGYIFGDKAR